MMISRRFFGSFLAQRARDSSKKGLAPLTGNLSSDGLHRYELDFFETAEWTQDLLVKMQDDTFEISEYQHKDQPLCFQFNTHHQYDFTRPPPINNSVKLWSSVSMLPLNAQERHNFLLIAGKAYDPRSDTVCLIPEETVDAPPQETCSRQENVNHLSQTLDRMIQAARVIMTRLTCIGCKRRLGRFTCGSITYTHAKERVS